MPRFQDLTPAEQRQIRSGRAEVAGRKLPTPSRAAQAVNRGAPQWECSRCRAQFAWLEGPNGVEAHMDDEHGGGRFDWILR